MGHHEPLWRLHRGDEPGRGEARFVQQGDAAIEAALAKIATDDCLSDGELTMSRPLFRGAIYRALYLRDFGNMSPESLAAPGSGNDQSGETADAFPMYIFSNCVVRLSADSARAFVMASPATPDENCGRSPRSGLRLPTACRRGRRSTSRRGGCRRRFRKPCTSDGCADEASKGSGVR